LQAIIEQCPVELAAKLAKVGGKLAKQEAAQQQGGVARFKLTINNSLRSFENVCKGLIGHQVTDQKLSSIFSSLEKISRQPTPIISSSPESSPVFSQIKKVLEKGERSYSDNSRRARVNLAKGQKERS